MPFLTLSFELTQLSAQQAEDACFAAGALAVTLTDSADDPVLEPAPGEVRLWPATRLQALFAADADLAVVTAALRQLLGRLPARLQSRLLEDRRWEREWLKDFHAMRFGQRLWVCPRHEPNADPRAAVVILDPGLAFGTGTHATTALCLEWLDAHPPVAARVIDYGCGSGILGIAALKLGARQVACHDIDPQALIATADNARDNGVEQATLLCALAAQLPPNADLLLANILSGPLCALTPVFAGLVRAGGQVLLSGLMSHEEAEVTRAYAPWFDIRRIATREGWVALEAMRRA